MDNRISKDDFSDLMVNTIGAKRPEVLDVVRPGRLELVGYYLSDRDSADRLTSFSATGIFDRQSGETDKVFTILKQGAEITEKKVFYNITELEWYCNIHVIPLFS